VTAMQPTAASETFPNGTGPAQPRALPMTRARRVALALGVPACLALTAWGAFAIVGEIGQGHFPVSAAIPVSGGEVTAHFGGGSVLLQQGAAGQAKLTGTAHYSLVRPTFTAQRVGSGASFGYNCDLPVGNCGLDATVTVPAGTATTISTDGGNATVSGTTGDVTMSSGGGNVTADHAAGDLTLTTDGGNINGTALTAAHVTAGTGGGDVQIEFAMVPDNIHITSDGGNITIIVPRGTAQYDVNASSAGGNVTDLLSINTFSPHTITATTGGGDITLREAP
jgi:Putative adhesin